MDKTFVIVLQDSIIMVGSNYAIESINSFSYTVAAVINRKKYLSSQARYNFQKLWYAN